MRGIAPFVAAAVAGALLGSCSTTPEQAMRSAKSDRQLQEMLSGKIARPAVSCVPPWNANDMTIIDQQTVAFRRGTGRVYVVRLTDGCNQLGIGPYALLTNPVGGTGLCRGDIAQVIDTMNRMTVGSCTIAEITPYERAG